MQTNRFSISKLLWMLPVFAGFTILTIIYSCNQNAQTDVCLSLSEAKLKGWFPAHSNEISVLEFFPVFDAVENNYDMTVKAFNAAKVQVGSTLTFNSGTCNPNLPLNSLGQHYQVFLADLNILKPDGSLKDNF